MSNSVIVFGGVRREQIGLIQLEWQEQNIIQTRRGVWSAGDSAVASLRALFKCAMDSQTLPRRYRTVSSGRLVKLLSVSGARVRA